ncbi:MAG: dihydropteroate synthase [Synechococcus sp.]|nr:dihydropteroate synthase [Synechococcus sp.]
MGVLNLTPDSFSDGGRLGSLAAVQRQARRLLAAGVDLLDLGGQSTRPGAVMVGAAEELRRLLPALRLLVELRQAGPAFTISIDTFDAAVAEAALAEGADWINDVRGANVTATAPGGSLRDAAMLPLIARAGCPYVLMHSRGTSESMDRLATYADPVAEVRAELLAASRAARAAGLQAEQLIWDPGLGFAKNTGQNLLLLRHLDQLAAAGYPLLVGPSRKRFIGAVLQEPRPRARLWGTAAVCALALTRGASVLRVHDGGPIVQTVRMTTAVMQAAPMQAAPMPAVPGP